MFLLAGKGAKVVCGERILLLSRTP